MRDQDGLTDAERHALAVAAHGRLALTDEQLAVVAQIKAGARSTALLQAADDLARVGGLLLPGSDKTDEGVFHKGFVISWLRARAERGEVR